MNTECLTNNNSSSWTIFSTKLSSGCNFKSQAACLTFFSNSKSRFLGTSKDGNKSLIKPKKTGLSSQIILGKLKSRRALMSTWSSGRSGSPLLSAPKKNNK